MVLFGPVVVNLLALKVNVLDRGSSLSMGPNQQLDFFLSNKQNYGLGEENGDFSLVNCPLNIVNDSDVSDSNSQKTSMI